MFRRLFGINGAAYTHGRFTVKRIYYVKVIYMNDKEKENQLTEEDLHKVSGGATKFKTANMMWVDRSNYEDFLTRTPRAILMAGKMWGRDSQQQANVLEEYAGTDSKVTIGVLDVDEHERFSHRLHIEWTPTVIYPLPRVPRVTCRSVAGESAIF